jgi:hypothetical protein
MKGLLVLLIMYSIVISLSIVVRRLTISLKSKWAYIILPVYIILTTSYIELVNWVTNNFRDKKIYLDMGHANMGIFLLGLISYVTAFGFIMNIIYVRQKQ